MRFFSSMNATNFTLVAYNTIIIKVVLIIIVHIQATYDVV